MSNALRVLIVEDSENDALLLVRALGRAGYEVTHDRVDTAEAMTAALVRQSWDIVISDHSMPHFSGSEALALLKRTGLDIPFIFVSGTIGEETAVSAMKAGAQDYVMKGNLARLIPAIERELQEAEVRIQRRRAEQQVQLHRQRQAALYALNFSMTSTLELAEVLNSMLDTISRLLPYCATAVRLWSERTRELEAVASRNLWEERWRTEEWHTEGSPAYRVFESKAPLAVGNLQADPGARDNAFFREERLVSYLGVPLIAKGQAVGVLSFYTRSEQIFDAEEIEFLSTLAGQAAIAIYNSQLYEQTRDQAEALERANKVKDEFLSIMSHELKTPITVINGYARMMQESVVGEVNREQQDILGRILSCSGELLAMVSGILDATRLETRAITVERRAVKLGLFLDEIRSDYNFLIEKDLALRWEYPSDLPAIDTDALKLRQILQNLIQNAIKFTNRGEIVVRARCLPDQRAVELSVRDTGVGIPPESIPMIFERFHQVDSSTRRTHGGIGLGLYIVKHFAEMLGGTLHVRSEPGKGSTFAVTIPLSA